MFFDLYSFSNVFCFVWIGFLLIPAHESLSAEEVICQVIVYRTHDPAFIHHKVGSPSVSKSSLCRNQAINPFCTDKYSSQAKKGFLCWKIRKQICQIRTSLQKSHIVTYERSVRNMEEIEEIIGYCYTGDDFIEECKRNVKMAEQLFYYGDWQHPSFRIS